MIISYTKIHERHEEAVVPDSSYVSIIGFNNISEDALKQQITWTKHLRHMTMVSKYAVMHTNNLVPGGYVVYFM